MPEKLADRHLMKKRRSISRSGENPRLALIQQTICSTGIRVSELQFITVEAVRRGKATVSLKGKIRHVFIVRDLQKKLLRYIAERKIRSGVIFVSRTGKCLNRTTVWREMKSLCAEARVDPHKVFPHNHIMRRGELNQYAALR